MIPNPGTLFHSSFGSLTHRNIDYVIVRFSKGYKKRQAGGHGFGSGVTAEKA